VRDVTAGHQEAVRADGGRLAGLGRAVDGDMLADHGARPDTHARRRLGLEPEILGVAAEHCIGMHDHAVLEMTVTADERVRVNHAALTETGAFLDERGRMNAHRASA
jgi:hypothetical protein